MHNLSTVIRFEIVRALKKKSFWILAISFPLVFAATFGILFLSNKATDDAAEKLKEQSFSVAITDESNLVKPSLIAAAKAAEVKPSDKQAAINRVKDGQLDAYIYYPKDLDHQPIEIYGKDVGIFDNGRHILSVDAKSAASGALPRCKSSPGHESCLRLAPCRPSRSILSPLTA